MDRWYANLPQPVPQKERLEQCKVISHRGEHDNKRVLENTIPAFDEARDRGVWGLECDVRWTKDLQPVVFHDSDLQRLLHAGLAINDLTLNTLKADFPLIPTLEEFIIRYGGLLHLMIELKKEAYPDPARQSQTLQDLLHSLKPGTDFHILSLTPDMFGFINFLQPSALLPVSLLNIRQLSALTVREKYGGITGHYAFLQDYMLAQHQNLGQKVGTGFIFSKNCLFRELNRGVDWIFTNHAAKLQSIRESYL